VVEQLEVLESNVIFATLQDYFYKHSPVCSAYESSFSFSYEKEGSVEVSVLTAGQFSQVPFHPKTH
jgi:hypothetical protein